MGNKEVSSVANGSKIGAGISMMILGGPVGVAAGAALIGSGVSGTVKLIDQVEKEND